MILKNPTLLEPENILKPTQNLNRKKAFMIEGFFNMPKLDVESYLEFV